VRRGRLGPQPRGIRGDPPQRARPPPQRQPALRVVAETRRLRLRRFTDADVETLALWNADPRFYRYLTPRTADETLIELRRWQRHWEEHGFGLLAVEDRETSQLIGRSGVQYHRLWPSDPEVGWAFDPEWWGRGLATEAGAASVGWAFRELGLERLVSIAHPVNGATRRVMEKLGFHVLTERHSEVWGPLLVHVLDRTPREAETADRRS
jgi:ribosomal-protein-alanine N-acetyltransferase